MNIYESWICQSPIAHRGLHDEEAPENSLAAFKKAIDAGFPIELDVRPLADGTLVVFHDELLGRMTGADGFISNYTYDDIKDLTLLKTQEKIPTFEEALEFIGGQVPLLIEIKNSGKVSFEKNVLKALSKYSGEYAVQSFNPYSLEWFKINAPHIKRGQLACFFKHTDPGIPDKLGFVKKFVLKRMLLNKHVSEPNFINYFIDDLPNRFVKKYKDIPVLAYMVNSPETLAKAKKCANNIVFEGIIPTKEQL